MNTNDTDPFHERVTAVRLRLLEAAEALVEKMTPPPAPAAPPLRVARRMLANQWQFWRYCDMSRCRRSQCCRGEPRNCLRIAIPLLPPDELEDLIRPGEGATRRRRHSNRGPKAG